MTSTITPLYLAELAPLGGRGTLLTSYQLFITVGILLAFGVGLVLSASGDWRWMIAIGVVPAVAQVVVASIVPPSPLFLVHQGDLAGARSALHRLRPPEEAEAELRALLAGAHDAPEVRPRLFEPRFRPGVTVGLVMALMNALVGVGAVIYYSSDVFRTAGLTGASGAETASLAVGGVNTLGALLSIWLTSRYGRRPLLTVGLAGIVVSLAIAGVTLMLPAGPQVGTVTVAAVLAYMVFFAISAGPLAWLLLAEVMPADVRARAASLATAANWGANLLVALLFPVVVGDPGIPARVGLVFVVFAVLSVGFLIYVRLRVPETKGRTLEAIEADLRQTSRRAG
jgi:sugar porter (SP) family MFS transporter